MAAKLLGFKDDIDFRCHAGLGCFTKCCADVTIFLTPFDVLRLAQATGLDSSLFLARYTLTLQGPRPILPLVILKMDESRPGKPCPLVTAAGCAVYPHRPWACRMFPLDQISPHEFQKVAKADSFCLGLHEPHPQKVIDYLHEQGVDHSAMLDALYQEITTHPRLAELDVDNPQVAKMIRMACYDLDRFAEFVFESSFLDKFEIEPERLAAIKNDRVELLKLAFDWVKFGLFAEKSLKVKAPEKKA